MGAGGQGIGSPRRLKAADRDALLFGLEHKLACRGLSAEDIGKLLADEFVEFGASGKVWRKREIAAAIADEQPTERIFEEFTVRELSPSVCLVTYRVVDPDRSSLRSSLWRYVGGSWQMLFHQGTLVK